MKQYNPKKELNREEYKKLQGTKLTAFLAGVTFSILTLIAIVYFNQILLFEAGTAGREKILSTLFIVWFLFTIAGTMLVYLFGLNSRFYKKLI